MGAFFFTTTIRSVGYHQELEAVYASVPSIIEETPQAVLQHTHPAVDTSSLFSLLLKGILGCAWMLKHNADQKILMGTAITGYTNAGSVLNSPGYRDEKQ